MCLVGDHYRTGKPPQHKNYASRSSQAEPSLPWVGQNEYWLWFQPPLGKNGESCITVGPVTRTAVTLACSQLKLLAVNGVGQSVMSPTKHQDDGCGEFRLTWGSVEV